MKTSVSHHRTVLGYAHTLTNLGIYRHAGSFAYATTLSVDVLKISAAWGWCTFIINTTLTAAILGKIMFVDLTSNIICNQWTDCFPSSVTRMCNKASVASGIPYSLIIEAVVESALVTWFGVLFYEVTSIAPQGQYTACTLLFFEYTHSGLILLCRHILTLDM